MAHPFNDPVLRDWLFPIVVVLDEKPLVLTEGYRPFDGDDLAAFLESRFRVNSLQAKRRPTSEILVVGQEGWKEQNLLDFIRERTGQTIKIYSQEMFLSYLLTDKDPFDAGNRVLKRFAKDHPALEYLSTLGFDWPSAFAPGGGITDVEADWPKRGLLRHMGYKVGNRGKKPGRRHEILKTVFRSGNLPQVQSRAYMAEWGGPSSSKRLKKMADSIASFCRNAKRRSSPPKKAIQEWEQDLDWLYDTFYRGRFSFSWPSTYAE